jgi:hypothetical protein
MIQLEMVIREMEYSYKVKIRKNDRIENVKYKLERDS